VAATPAAPAAPIAFPILLSIMENRKLVIMFLPQKLYLSLSKLIAMMI
jgi:hypothetical protein